MLYNSYYFEDLIDLYEQRGIKKGFFIYPTARKSTNIYIWECDNVINFSNDYSYKYKKAEIQDHNEVYSNKMDLPVLIYETNNSYIINDLLNIINSTILKGEDYKKALEELKNVTKDRELELIKTMYKGE